MFKPEPSITWSPPTREQVVARGEHQPAAGLDPGEAAAGGLGPSVRLRNPNGSFSIYAVLHLPKTGENVVYVPDRRQLTTVDEYRAIELEGLQFLESMGFMLDNLNFRNLAPEAQDQTLRRVPLFSPPRPPSSSRRGAHARRARRVLRRARRRAPRPPARLLLMTLTRLARRPAPSPWSRSAAPTARAARSGAR